MTAPGTIWASVGYRSENDIRGEFACHPDLYKGSEQYTRTATIPDPMDDPRVVALVRAADMLDGVSDLLRAWTPFEVLKQPDAVCKAFGTLADRLDVLTAALSAITKEPPHER